MTTNHPLLSTTRINFLKAQGYCNLSDVEISELAFGNRFAFFGIILPYHPIECIYNYLLRNMLNKPKLPPHSKQLKFTCVIATLWLIATTYLFYSGLTTAGYILGGLLVSVAFNISATDFCIPSMI